MLYVLPGKFFSDRVQAMSELLGDLVWMIVGLLFVVIFGSSLLQYFRPAPKDNPSGCLANEKSQ